jgi:hypothetical protein
MLVLGYLVGGPIGGLACHHLQYVLGLAQLGHDVYFLEDSGDSKWCCYKPETGAVGEDATYCLRIAAETFTKIDLPDRWAYHDAHKDRWSAPCGERATRLAATADVLFNVSNVNRLRPWLAGVPVRVLIDTDPVFTQIAHVTDPKALAQSRQHTAFFSFGANFAHQSCAIPRDGLPWQPLVLDAWRPTRGPDSGRFTTVMQWEAIPPRSTAA